MKRLLSLALPCLLLTGCVSGWKTSRSIGPWNMAALEVPPQVTWGARTGLVQELFYQGEPFQGKPTRIFAYLGRPAEGTGPFPAMLLVHGGGGKAFKDWAEHWAKRGYVALAMDTAGAGPNGRLPDGGPGQDDAGKFRNFTIAEVRELWTYHAVAAGVRGHSLLAILPEVDANRIGITGISWGGYLTCIVAGIDSRLKVAVPVYGCGFLGENSCWKDTSLAAMAPDARDRWLKYFDPSRYLRGVNCPILFLNGSNDFAYPMDSYRKSYELVSPAWRTVCVKIRMPHGHLWTFGEVDAFVDSVLRGGPRLPTLGPLTISGTNAAASVTSPVPLKKAEFHFTTDSGAWQKRQWQTVPAVSATDSISAVLPPGRPLVCYLSVTDERGLQVSTSHAELAATR
jgi:dienelactone hydrolase